MSFSTTILDQIEFSFKCLNMTEQSYYSEQKKILCKHFDVLSYEASVIARVFPSASANWVRLEICFETQMEKMLTVMKKLTESHKTIQALKTLIRSVFEFVVNMQSVMAKHLLESKEVIRNSKIAF